MPGKMARSDPRPSVRVTRGAGSDQHLASVLQEGRENANIDAGLGFIWRISVKAVDLVAWDALPLGMGYRTRRRGDYLLVLQKRPLAAKNTWRDHSIPSRWPEKVDRTLHPHIKPIGLMRKLISAVTRPGDLVVDPAAGSFVVMHAAHQLGCDFVGCDLAYRSGQPHLHGEMNEYAPSADPR